MRQYCYMRLTSRCIGYRSEAMANVESLIAKDDIVSLATGYISFKCPTGNNGEFRYVPFICQYDKSFGSFWDSFTQSYSGYRINFVDVVTKRTYISNEFLSNYGQRKFEAGEIELGQYLTNNNVDIASDKVVEILKSLTPQDQLIYIEGLNTMDKSCEFVRSQAFKSSIKKLEKQREDLSAEEGITDDIIEKYNNLEIQISEQIELLMSINNEEPNIVFLNDPYVYIPKITEIDFDGSHRYDFTEFLSTKELLEQSIEQVNKAILDIWNPTLQKVSKMILEERKSVESKLADLNNEFIPLQQIVAKNDQLKKIDYQLKEEKKKLKNSLELEKEKSAQITESEKLKKQILQSRNTLLRVYEEFSNVLELANSPDTDLIFRQSL